jgi:sec-independent protein translocase protein TatA
MPADGVPPSGWYGGSVNLGAPELLIVLIVILVLFGGSKLPKLARSLGQAQNEFKQGIKEGSTSDDDDAPPTAQ